MVPAKPATPFVVNTAAATVCSLGIAKFYFKYTNTDQTCC